MKNIMKKYKNKRGFWWPSLSKDEEFNKIFNEKYPYAKDENIQYKGYIVLNDLKYEDIKCPGCDNIVRFNKNKNKLFVYCSNTCSKQHMGKNISKSKSNRTSEEKKKTNEKRRNTNLKRYGYTEQFVGLKDQIKNTMVSKYGVDNLFKDSKWQLNNQKKLIKTNNHALKNGKAKKAYKLKHNINNFSQHSIANYDKWYDAEFIEQNFLDDKRHILVNKMRKFFNVSQVKVNSKFKELNIEYKKRKGDSEAETEIIDFINNPSTIQGDRSLINKELDILVPNNFAVEYQGLMFHSHGTSEYSMFNNPKDDKKKHLIKTELCEACNIQLYQIWENEWSDINKQNIWKSVLNSKQNKTKRIYARKCEVKEIDKQTSKIFEKNNHLQGIGTSSIQYGLYYKDELVSVMTFKKDPKYQYELNRFCSKLNTTIVGGASKLLKHFERTIKPDSLVSYANRRWSTGNLYKTIGFTYSHTSAPNYFYFHTDDPDVLWSRVSFQKHKLENKLELFDNALSETNNMYNNNYRKIYDAGNLVYIKKYQDNK